MSDPRPPRKPRSSGTSRKASRASDTGGSSSPSTASGPRTILPEGRRLPRFAGVSTFCRFPDLANISPEQAPLDWVVYGVPFDGGVTYRPGARFGPRAVRNESQYIKPYHLELEVNIAEKLSIADGGDAPVAPYSCRDTVTSVLEFARTLGQRTPASGRPHLLAIGGDHSIAYMNIRAAWERAGSDTRGLALLHFDAHLDTVDSVWGERWGHASPFIRAIEEGCIDPERMISIGIRGPLNTATDLDFARRHGINVVTVDRLSRGDGHEAIETFRRRVEDAPLYVSIDIDCLDPAFAPGTGTPCCGGLSTRELFGLLRRFAGANLCGADIVEVLPDRDVAGITALTASHLVLEVLALAARRRT